MVQLLWSPTGTLNRRRALDIPWRFGVEIERSIWPSPGILFRGMEIFVCNSMALCGQ